MTVGLITAADGWSYQLTPTDLDWLSREIANEGGRDDGTLWTMAQRLYALRNTFSSMTSMVRAFSQPVNPRWLAGGDLCQAHPAQCTAAELAKRERAQDPNTTYPQQLAYVQRWAAGGVPNPVPRAIDFRACDAAARTLVSSGQATLVLSSGNCYVARDGSENWPADMVLVAGTGTGAPWWTGPLVGLGVALAAGVVAWVAAEELRP